MKHSLKITAFLVLFFLISQFLGLYVVSEYIPLTKDPITGKYVVGEVKDLPGGIERPEVDEDKSYLLLVYIGVAILIGTLLILYLIKRAKLNFIRFWIFFSVFVTLTFAIGAFIPALIAVVISMIAAYWKVFRPNIYIHNAAELLMYGGLAAIFVPIKAFTIPIAFALLILISIYDMWAVWHSKHMVTLAKGLSKSNLFAGLSIPYKRPKRKVKGKNMVTVKRKVTSAVLGGGDIGFPLLFAGVAMKTMGLAKVLIIPVFAAVALFALLVLAKKDRFYPAMPVVSIGCVVGYLVMFLF